MNLSHRSGITEAIAWDVYGTGDGVPLVALHGWSDSGACWTPSVPVWAVGRTMLTVDARGHGRTPLPDEPFTIAALAADVATVIREVLAGPAVVLGHSMGGLVAEELALAHPELVAALVLEDPSWRRPRDVDDRGVPRMLRDVVLAMAGEDAEALRSGVRAANPLWPDDELVPWADAKVQLDTRIVDVPHEWDGRDWIESLGGLALPVTLLTGEPERGAILGVDEVARARALLGGHLTHHSFVAGHCVRRDARAAVEAAVLRALESADDARGAIRA